MQHQILINLIILAILTIPLSNACKNERSQAPSQSSTEQSENPGLTQHIAIERDVEELNPEEAIGIAEIESLDNSDLTGKLIFYHAERGPLRIDVQLSGLAPGSVHAVNIHENDQCGKQGLAAGDHFNPTSQPHGRPQEAASHAGDLGNITADSNGKVNVVLARVTPERPSFSWSSIFNHAVIIYANEDTFMQPDGNAGKRIGCGVIKAFEQ